MESSGSSCSRNLTMLHSNNNNNNSHFTFRCYYELPVYVVNEHSKVNFTFIAVSDILLAIPAFILNSLFMYTVYKHSKFRKTVSNCLFINLAGLGLFTSLVYLPMHATRMILASMEKPNCNYFAINDCSSYTVSTLVFLSLICITLDSYCGVITPFFYQRHFTRIKIITLLWAVCILFIIFTVFTCVYDMVLVYTVVVCLLVIMGVFWFIFAYAHIYFTVSRMHRRISCVSVESIESGSSSSSSNGAAKTRRTSSFIVLAFILSYLPTGIYAILQAAGLENVTLRTYVFHWVYTIRLSSCLINAFLYYWRLKNLRTASIQLIPSCLKREEEIDYRAKKEAYLREVSVVRDVFPGRYQNSTSPSTWQ